MSYVGIGQPLAHLDAYSKAQFDAWLSGRNKLINGCFSVAQRGTLFDSATDYPNNDDTYTLDRWILLSDGNNVFDVSQSTTVANHAPGAQYGIKLEVETVAKKGGILQIIENKKVERLFKNGTGKCSLSFTSHTSDATNMAKIRAAVLAWNSTADTVTSDVVSAWNAEDTNPTLVSNWTYENTPVELAGLTSTPTRYELTDIALDTPGTKNIAVFVWSENTSNGIDDAITITDVQLEAGSTCSPFEALEFENVERNCFRYFERISVSSTLVFNDGFSSSSSDAHSMFNFHKKRSTPNIILPPASTSNGLSFLTTVGNYPSGIGSHVADQISNRSFRLRATGYSGLTGGGQGCFLYATQAQHIDINAEL